HVDLRARLISPVDGDLDDAVAATAGEEKQLDVEAEALGLELVEEHRRHRSTEELEAALRVLHVAHAQALGEEVEGLSRDLPVRVDLAAYRGIVQGTR